MNIEEMERQIKFLKQMRGKYSDKIKDLNEHNTGLDVLDNMENARLFGWYDGYLMCLEKFARGELSIKH